MSSSAAPGASLREAVEENPFYVLALPVTASRREVEREGQKLLGMLELKLEDAQRYRTPLGVHLRTADLVRNALARLRDPRRRLESELFAVLPPVPPPSSSSAPGRRARKWTDAFRILGFVGPRG